MPAVAKGRLFGKLDTELKLMVGFLGKTAEAYSIVTVPSVDPEAPPQACYQILSNSRRNVLIPTFDSKRERSGSLVDGATVGGAAGP